MGPPKDSNGAVTYEEKSDEFIFIIESWGQLDPQEIVEKALAIHNNHLKEFKKLVKS